MAEVDKKITVQRDGPYVVEGGVPLVRKSQVMSEHGEPMTWRKNETLSTGERYALCRCGKSRTKPLCDGMHEILGFEGNEMADPGPMANREVEYKATGMVLKDDRSLCVHSGFCGNQITNVWKMTQETGDTRVRAQLMAMVERCPSGALAYVLEGDDENLEPDLPVEVAVIPDGPLWVSGGIPIERADGLPVEIRNRVTLCRCGASKNKPLCDGTHKSIGFTAD